MALIKMGSVVAEISGSLDGITYSHNRNGRYVRARVKPTNPRSVKQAAVRSQFTTLSQQWRSLSTTQRTAWASLGAQMTQTNRLGAATSLTGQQAYISINQLRLTGGQTIQNAAPILDSAPTVSGLTATVSFTVAGSVPLVNIAYTSSGSASQSIRIYATGLLSAGKSYVRKSQYRLLTTIAANAASPAVLTSAWQATYGTLSAGAAGARVSFLLIPVSTNYIAGTAARVDAIVVTI